MLRIVSMREFMVDYYPNGFIYNLLRYSNLVQLFDRDYWRITKHGYYCQYSQNTPEDDPFLP